MKRFTIYIPYYWFYLASSSSYMSVVVESYYYSAPNSRTSTTNKSILTTTTNNNNCYRNNLRLPKRRDRKGQLVQHDDTIPSKKAVSKLFARRGYKNNYNDDNENDTDRYERYYRLESNRPTQTQTDTPLGPIIPMKPKIIILGASGRIGRLVVRQLLEMSSLDATIVAFCRDYDKACRVLYDDIVVARTQKHGPRLQIIQGNLVPPDCLPGYKNKDDDDNDDDEYNDEERQWKVRAESAAKFYGTKIETYDNRSSNATTTIPTNNEIISYDEALEDAIKDCTVIINCVGSTRITNFWTDYFERPLWRLLRRDVSSWCNDPDHPYYTHYLSTSKTVRLAEKEQLRRQAAADATAAAVNEMNNLNVRNQQQQQQQQQSPELIPRIRYIRISDLVCSEQPWHFVPLVTNIIQSMVLRYQIMAESVMESSTLLDTITVRPGDLTNELRDESTTSIQINPTGCMKSPSRIGRDDVASIAVSAALFDFNNNKNNNNGALHQPTTTRISNNHITTGSSNNHQQQQEKEPQHHHLPFHYTLACRWTSENLDPYPAQGKKSDGYPTAVACLKAIFPTLDRQRRRRGLSKSKKYNSSIAMQQIVEKYTPTTKVTSNKLKLYGICAAIPVYLLFAIVFRAILQAGIQFIPGVQLMMPLLRKTSDIILSALIMIVSSILQLRHNPFAIITLPFWHRSAPKYIPF